jgi:mannosylglycoprotein endo-beta-mannosidase
VFLTGGNWIHTDQFLRYASNSKRYFNEVNMHVQMGMNIIRVWGGGLTERPEFYNAADRLGMLIMQEFWMTGRPN